MFERKSILNILNESLLILEVITLQCNAIGDLKPRCKYRFVTITVGIVSLETILD